MIVFQKIQLPDESMYEVAIDDHCLVIKSGKAKVWLSKSFIKWIKENEEKFNYKRDTFTEAFK